MLEKVRHISFQTSRQFGGSKMNSSRNIQSCFTAMAEKPKKNDKAVIIDGTTIIT